MSCSATSNPLCLALCSTYLSYSKGSMLRCHCRRFARVSIKLGKLRLILPNGEERLYGGDEASTAPPVAAGKHMPTCTQLSSG